MAFFTRNNKLRTFLLFFIISSFLWFLSKLSNNYKHDLSLPVVYVNVGEDAYAGNFSNDTLTIVVNASGYELLGDYFKKTVFHFDVSKNHLLKNKTWHPNDYRVLINQVIGKEHQILQIFPEVVGIDTKEVYKKKVKVKVDAVFNYKQGFKNKAVYQLQPDEIWIFGDKNILDTIRFVNTKHFVFKNIDASVQKELSLKLPDFVQSNYKKIFLKIQVDQFIENTQNLDFAIKNVPDSLDVVVFPKKAIIKYKVFRSDFKSIKKSDFKVVLDYKTLVKTKDTVLMPKLVQQPKKVFDVEVIPHDVLFLRKKKI